MLVAKQPDQAKKKTFTKRISDGMIFCLYNLL